MRTHMLQIVAIAALVLAIICTVSPTATVIANEMTGEVYGIDLFGIAKVGQDEPGKRLAGK
jgi:hypothetical protein